MSMRWRKVMFNGLTGRNQRSTGVYVPTLFAVIRNDVVKKIAMLYYRPRIGGGAGEKRKCKRNILGEKKKRGQL